MSNIWMPLYVADYLSKTGHISTVEHGAYLLLIMHYWQTEEPLAEHDPTLAQITRLRLEQWKKIRPNLQGFFCRQLHGLWVHEKVEHELYKAMKLREKKSKAGIASANARSTPVKQVYQQDTQHTGNQLQPPSQESKIVSFSFGKEVKDKKSPEWNLSVFQKWLAEGIGKEGWRIVGEAADPESTNYKTAVAFCKNWAEEHGKGWPWNWPKIAIDG